MSFLNSLNDMKPNFKPIPKLLGADIIVENSFQEENVDWLIEKFHNYFVIKYKKPEWRDADTINREKLIKAFPNPQSAYDKLKSRFHCLNQEDEFNFFLRSD